MPKTKMQSVIFTVMMVSVMAYGMIVYNIAISKGGMTNDIFLAALGELPVKVILGVILEICVAGPLSKKMAFCLVNPEKDREIAVILTVSIMTVCVMCPMMSAAAVLFLQGVTGEFMAKWVQTAALNFPMALGWQIFFAGPLVRKVFKELFSEKRKKLFLKNEKTGKKACAE